MAIELPLNSRYRFTEIIDHLGIQTLGRWPGFKWLDSEPSQVIVVDASRAGRPDLIANEYLGSPDLWWAIVYYNNARDINWPRPGDEVSIPNANEVQSTDIGQSR